MVVGQVACLGFSIDEERNGKAGDMDGRVTDVGKNVLVCRTDEQFEMARGCAVEARKFKEERA